MLYVDVSYFAFYDFFYHLCCNCWELFKGKVSKFSINLDKVSAKVLQIPGLYSKVMFCYSSSPAQLLTLEFMVFSSRDFLRSR